MLTIYPTKPKSDAEYQRLIDLHNLAWPDEPAALASWRYRDENRPEGRLYQRFAAEEDGLLIASGQYSEAHWTVTPDKYRYRYDLLPEREEDPAAHRAIYDFVIEQLAARRPTHIATGTREDRTFRVQWLKDQGFVRNIRMAESKLDLTTFDFGRFNGAQERVESVGVKILPLSDLRKIDPNYQRKLYDMLWEIEQDVPQPDPPKQEPFEEFLKLFDDPDFWPEGWQMAIDPSAGNDGVGDDDIGAYVGVSMLGKNLANPKRINTWLTGVVRSHRRKGIALAMKLRAIEFAIQNGGTAIMTDNEENNPMLGINKALGFVEIPAGVGYEKEL